MSFLQDVHPEVIDALLGFVYDPLDPALDDLLNIPFHGNNDDAFLLNPLHGDSREVERHCAKKQRAWRGLAEDIRAGQHCNGGGRQQVPGILNEFVLPLQPPPLLQQQQFPEPVTLVRAPDAKKQAAADNGVSQSVQSAAARQRRKRISEKTAALSRLIPGGHKLNTAEMLEAAARHVKLLQAQVGMLALMHNLVGSSTEKEEKMPFMAAQAQMRALLGCGGVQERLAAEGRCLVPRKLVDAVAKDTALKSNPMVNRDLGRFVASLPQQGQ